MGKRKRKYRKGRELQFDELHNIIMKIPSSTFGLNVEAQFLEYPEDGSAPKTRTATMNLDSETIKQLRQDFLDNVEDGDYFDVRFVATEKGEKLVEELERGRL